MTRSHLGQIRIAANFKISFEIRISYDQEGTFSQF